MTRIAIGLHRARRMLPFSLIPRLPLQRRKGGSGEYNTSSHYGLAVAMDSAKS